MLLLQKNKQQKRLDKYMPEWAVSVEYCVLPLLI